MLRTVVKIDEEACNGCGLCVRACHEGAIGLVGGKARLLRDDYCDGMGDCLPACPQDAISFEEREAAAYDEAAVAAAKAGGAAAGLSAAPGTTPAGSLAASARLAWDIAPAAVSAPAAPEDPASQLAQWPCQIKLVPVNAPYFAGADLVVAADCTAYARADFHARFMAGRVTLVGCPKLDAVDYAEKLGAILAANDVRSVLLTRMDVPCCGGLERAVRAAITSSGKNLPLTVVTIGRDGRIL